MPVPLGAEILSPFHDVRVSKRALFFRPRAIRVFADFLVGLGFSWSVSYIKPFPTHEKLFAVAKCGPNATFNLRIFGVWLALG